MEQITPNWILKNNQIFTTVKKRFILYSILTLLNASINKNNDFLFLQAYIDILGCYYMRKYENFDNRGG